MRCASQREGEIKAIDWFLLLLDFIIYIDGPSLYMMHYRVWKIKKTGPDPYGI